MTDKITIDRAVLQQALDWADSHGEQVFFWAGMKSVDAMNSWSRPMREALAAPQPAQDAVDADMPLDKDELARLIAPMLYGTYHCTRVWEAWNVGTMSRDDFEPVDESDTPYEIADAIRAAIAAQKGKP